MFGELEKVERLKLDASPCKIEFAGVDLFGIEFRMTSLKEIDLSSPD